ncbi:hypothetical protein QP158_10595 [Streptococcus agalactiae]|nr:hypothetical protein [Streptococcus agalactiae]MDK6471395.1 hypothetical protein [Streptococcus agalactiae]MDK6486533.1 hypothetical protein [Streptococcus agalactiae]
MDGQAVADWLKVNRRTVQRWEQPDAGDIPEWAAEKLQSRWDSLVDKISDAIDYLDQLQQETGAPPEAVQMQRFKTNASCKRVNGPGVTAREHAIMVGIITAALQAEKYEVNLDWIPQEES